MRLVLIILLLLIFGYSLGLVLMNDMEVEINLLFTQSQPMNLGLLLIICIGLGVLIGMLLALLLFRVFQNKWEISRLNKENKRIKAELKETTIELDRHKNSQPVEPTLTADSQTQEKIAEPLDANTIK